MFKLVVGRNVLMLRPGYRAKQKCPIQLSTLSMWIKLRCGWNFELYVYGHQCWCIFKLIFILFIYQLNPWYGFHQEFYLQKYWDSLGNRMLIGFCCYSSTTVNFILNINPVMVYPGAALPSMRACGILKSARTCKIELVFELSFIWVLKICIGASFYENVTINDDVKWIFYENIQYYV